MAKLEIPDELVNPFIDYILNATNITSVLENEIRALIISFATSTLRPLPCPFQDVIKEKEHHTIKIVDNQGDWFVECSCGAAGELAVMFTEAIKSWNKRSGNGICPWCGCNDYQENWTSDDNQYFCDNCEGYGPKADTLEKAEGLWRKRQN